MKRLLIALIVGAFVATPAMADLFNFAYNPTLTSFDTTLSQFQATVADGSTVGSVARLVTPLGTALFDTTWGGPENFYLQMQVGAISINGDTATGNGFLTLTDVDDDQINADFIGTWDTDAGGVLNFEGALNNVFFTGLGGTNDTTFDGDSGAASMDFTGYGSFPFYGAIVELTTENPLLRFTDSWTDVLGAAVTGTVVPVPAALLLGVLGLGAAGVKLRRFV